MLSKNQVSPKIMLVVGILLLLPMILHAKSVRTMSDLSGGQGGNPFVALSEHSSAIDTITVRSGKYIDSIQLTFRTGNKKSQTLQYGGNGGSESSLTLTNGEYITRVSGRSGKFVDSLTIITNKGRKKHWGGNGGERSYQFSGSDKEPIIGLWGRAGSLVDAIGVVKYSPRHPGNGVNITPNKLNQFRSTAGPSDPKGDSAPSLNFPDSPPPNATNSQIYQWMADYNQRLEEIINELAWSDPGLNNLWVDEFNRCSSNLYCQMINRREVIAYITGLN